MNEFSTIVHVSITFGRGRTDREESIYGVCICVDKGYTPKPSGLAELTDKRFCLLRANKVVLIPSLCVCV